LPFPDAFARFIARRSPALPLIEGGKLIGAIGCSGGTGSQDETVCTVGANIINK
jgi:glc operon protein GlcG